MFYVYIIQSLKDRSYYKGFTENPSQRILQHNNKESHYTSHKIPWQLVYIEIFTEKRLALKREVSLKKYSHKQIEVLIDSSQNRLSEYLDQHQ